MINVLDFCSSDTSSNPAEVYIGYCLKRKKNRPSRGRRFPNKYDYFKLFALMMLENEPFWSPWPTIALQLLNNELLIECYLIGPKEKVFAQIS